MEQSEERSDDAGQSPVGTVTDNRRNPVCDMTQNDTVTYHSQVHGAIRKMLI
jgi:hypothetical protein